MNSNQLNHSDIIVRFQKLNEKAALYDLTVTAVQGKFVIRAKGQDDLEYIVRSATIDEAASFFDGYEYSADVNKADVKAFRDVYRH